jgi:DNA (cytosine-5)-methyltransferase 1
MLKILNLHAGIGGNRKSWKDVEVTAVEYNKEIAEVYKAFYPNDKVIVGDATEYLIKHWREFDFIWASPPCQTHSKMRYLASKRGSYDAKLPDLSLYEFILFLQHFCKDKKWVVENVVPYYEPLVNPTIKLDRHLIWSNFDIPFKDFKKPEVKHNKVTGTTERYGISLKDFKLKHRKDQIIRNCVNPELGEHLLNSAIFNKPEVTQCDLLQKNTKEDGIPPTNKLVGILPKIL